MSIFPSHLEDIINNMEASNRSIEDSNGYVDYFMLQAFAEAEKALSIGEVPIGCVLVRREKSALSSSMPLAQTFNTDFVDEEALNARIVSRGHNLTNAQHHALAHAEFVAIESLLNNKCNGNTTPDHKAPDDESDIPDHTYCKTYDDKSESDTILPYGCDLYVTVEPCIMCASLLLYHPMLIRRVFYGCGNPRFGGNGSVLAVNKDTVNCTSPEALQQDGNAEANPAAAAATGSAPTADECGGYPSYSGYRAEEAIALLQRFYLQENSSAPEEKRRRKEGAVAPTAS